MPDLLFGGVLTAATTPFTADGAVDLPRYADHCVRQLDQGVRGIVPNGSLGEYETLTDDERSALVVAAVETVGSRGLVVPGVSGKSAAEAVRWAQQAKDAGCPAVMCLPPTSHAPTDDEVLAHFAAVAEVGLPVIAYNNPYSTRVDLTPPLLARLAQIDGIAAVKEFAQDVRRFAHARCACRGCHCPRLTRRPRARTCAPQSPQHRRASHARPADLHRRRQPHRGHADPGDHVRGRRAAGRHVG